MQIKRDGAGLGPSSLVADVQEVARTFADAYGIGYTVDVKSDEVISLEFDRVLDIEMSTELGRLMRTRNLDVAM